MNAASAANAALAETLPIQHVAAVEAATELPWLVEGLWVERGVGFLGGHPKSCKSWLALDVALSGRRARRCSGATQCRVADRCWSSRLRTRHRW